MARLSRTKNGAQAPADLNSGSTAEQPAAGLVQEGASPPAALCSGGGRHNVQLSTGAANEGTSIPAVLCSGSAVLGEQPPIAQKVQEEASTLTAPASGSGEQNVKPSPAGPRGATSTAVPNSGSRVCEQLSITGTPDGNASSPAVLSSGSRVKSKQPGETEAAGVGTSSSTVLCSGSGGQTASKRGAPTTPGNNM